MGNRAVIATGTEQDDIGIYLHWNGGPESVLAFLDAARDLGVRDPLSDNYGVARLAQIIGNFLGGDNGIGIDTLANLDTDNGDNGMYVLGPDWTIAKRVHGRGPKSADGLKGEGRDKYESIKAQCIEQWSELRSNRPNAAA